jgi:hypothetical protein
MHKLQLNIMQPGQAAACDRQKQERVGNMFGKQKQTMQ